MKNWLFAGLIAATLSYAGILGCNVNDAQKGRFDKPTEYELMKECMSGSFGAQNIYGYNEKLDYCSCLIGALSCKFDASQENLNNASQKDLKKALENAQQCYDKSK